MDKVLTLLVAFACLYAGVIFGAESTYEKYSQEISIGQQVIAVKQNEQRLIQSLQADFEEAGLCDISKNVECAWKE